MATNERRPRFNAAQSLTRDFLTWLEDAPRTYADVMEVRRTSCPRFSIWEDAFADDLIQIESSPGKSSAQDRVTLTARGRAMLGASPPELHPTSDENSSSAIPRSVGVYADPDLSGADAEDWLQDNWRPR